jgi:membrane protein DedA with SNARE-associated domain
MDVFISEILKYVSQYGYISIGSAMFLDSANIPIPSEITLPYGGYLASISKLNLISIILVSTIATILGSILNYYLGFWGGRPLLEKHGRKLFLSKKDFEIGMHWFEKYGNWAVFLGRFIPGVRTFISFPAGVAKIKMWPFIIFTSLGSLIWCSVLTYIGFVLGDHWESIESFFGEFHMVIIAAFVILAFLYIVHKIRELRS